MLKDYNKFRIVDENKSKDFFAEVNWNRKDKSSNECKLVKFTFPNGDEALVKKELLISMLFSMGNPEEQRGMIPVKVQPVHWRTVQVSMKATKDIREGEDIVMNPIRVSIPCDQVKDIMGVDSWKKEVDRLSKREGLTT